MKKTILLLVLFPFTAFSQDKRTLTIEEAIQIGVQNNKALQISSLRAVEADARSSEVNAVRLPSVKLQAGYARLSDVDPFAVKLPTFPAPVTISPVVLNSYVTRLSLQQPLFSGLRLEKSAAAASYSADAASYDYVNEKVDLVYGIKSAYWNLYRAGELKHVIDENVAQVRAHLTDVQNMMNQGLVTLNEVLKVQVQLSSSELAQIDAANAIRIATMQLNNLIGLPLDTEILISSTLSPPAGQAPQVAEVAQQALDTRSDLKAAEMRALAAEASATAARGGWYPQVNVYGNVYYSRPNPRILPTRDEFKGTWDVGVNLSFDVWTWGTTKYQADQAEATVLQAREHLEQLKDAILLEVHQSYLSLLQSKEKVLVAQKGVRQAEENHRITQNKFRAGTATNTDLLDAELALLQARVSLTTSLIDHELADARLIRAMGREER
jgi:outer membrane protein